MNKNIVELAVRAGFATTLDPKPPLAQYPQQLALFAQLLLKECVTIAELSGNIGTANQIKHHFGL